MTKHKNMCSTIIIIIFAIVIINTIENGYGFNLENRLPIIKYGDAGTYFGYSLAAHEIGEKNETNNTKW